MTEDESSADEAADSDKRGEYGADVDAVPEEPSEQITDVGDGETDRRVKRRRVVAWTAAALTVVVVAGLLVVMRSGGFASERSGVGGPVTGADSVGGVSPSVTIIDSAQRQPALELSGETLSGQRWSLVDQRGYVVVLNVWASWCAPCRAEAPILSEVARRRAPDGVRFVGINIRDNDAAARAFEARYGITYPSLVDPNGQLLLQLRDVPPSVMPSTLVVDSQGRIAGRIIGVVTFATLNQIIDAAIGVSASGSPAANRVLASESGSRAGAGRLR